MITTSTATAGNQINFTTSFGNARDWRTKHRCNTIAFYTSGAITSWTLSLVNEAGAVSTVIYSGTSASFYTDELGPLPITLDGETYQLSFVTVGMLAGGTFTIDHQTVLTGAT